jgi:hypothetical protein
MSYVFCGDPSRTECNTIRQTFNGNVSNWDTSSVTTLERTFMHAYAFTGDGVWKWNTGKVTNLRETFKSATSFTGDGIKNWNTERVTSLASCFHSTTVFTGDGLINWNTARVTSNNDMFYNAASFTGNGLLNWNVEKFTSLSYTFFGATSFTGDGLRRWNTARVTRLDHTFYGTVSFKGDGVANWDVSKVTFLQQAFQGATSFTGYGVIPWNIESVSTFTNTFMGTDSMLSCTKRFLTKSWQNNAAFMSAYGNDWFANVPESECPCDFRVVPLTYYVDEWLRDSVQHDCGDITDWNIFNLTNLNSAFCADSAELNCNPARQNLHADLSKWNTAKITSMDSTFRNAHSIDWNSVKDWNTNSIVSLRETFRGVDTSFESAIESWNTAKLSSLHGTYQDTTNFTGDGIKNWDIGSVTDLSYTFWDASLFLTDVGKLDVSSVVDSTNVFSFSYSALDNCTKRSIFDAWYNVNVPESWGSIATCPRSILESLSYYYSDCLNETSCSCSTISVTCNECGEIPTFLQNCIDVTSLSIKSFGTLNGTIPTELRRLVNLETIDFTYAELENTIPVEFEDFTLLRELYLGDNFLSGTIPTDLFRNMPDLEMVYLAFNFFEGSVPRFDHLTNLRQVLLHVNHFDRILSDTFRNSESLNIISVASQGESTFVNKHVLNLEEFAFRGVPSQADIALGGNIIEELPRGVFSGRRNSILELQYLEMTTIRSNAFENTTNLQIRLMGNLLKSIAPDAFPDGTVTDSDCADFAGMLMLLSLFLFLTFTHLHITLHTQHSFFSRLTHTHTHTHRLGRGMSVHQGGGNV